MDSEESWQSVNLGNAGITVVAIPTRIGTTKQCNAAIPIWAVSSLHVHRMLLHNISVFLIAVLKFNIFNIQIQGLSR